MWHSYASFAFLTPAGAPADVYLTSWLPVEVLLRIFLFLEVSAEAPRLFFETFPHWDLLQIRVIDLLIFVDFLQVKISLFPIFFSFLLFFIELRFLFMIDIGKLLQDLRLTASQSPEAECRSGRND